MIRIAICDDEKNFVCQIKKILEGYSGEIGETICIEEFYDGVMLLDKYSCQFDIIFLDIKMPFVDGVKVAEKIRKRDPYVTIIFLTSILGRALDGYRVNAANFLVKPVKKEKVIHEIDNWIEENRMKRQECILIENKEGQFKVPIASIRYIETYNRNLLVHVENQSIVCYKKLKQIKGKLEPYGFAQIHKGILINMSYVNSIEGSGVILITKEELPVGRAMKKEFMQHLAEYLGG